MKKQKLSAKILSLALAMCMAFSLVPVAAPAAQAADDDQIVINLLNLGNAGEGSVSAFTGHNAEKSHALATGRNWYYDTENSTADVYQVWNTQVRATLVNGQKFILKFWADKAGTYMLSANVAKLPAIDIEIGGMSYKASVSGELEAGINTGDIGLVGVDEGWNTLTITGSLSLSNPVYLKTFTLDFISESKPFAYSFTASIPTTISPTWTATCPGFAEFEKYNQDKALNTWRFLVDDSYYVGAGGKGGANGTVRINPGLPAPEAGKPANPSIAFDMYVPAAGYYKATLDYTSWTNSVAATKITIDGNELDTINTQGAADTAHSVPLTNSVKLTKGWHKLVFTKIGTAGTYIGLRGISFMPEAEPTAPAAITKVIDFIDYSRTHAHEDKYTEATLDTYGWALSKASDDAVYNNNNTYSYNNETYRAYAGLLGFTADVGSQGGFDFTVSAPGYYTVSAVYDAISFDVDVFVDGYYVGALGSTGGIYLNGTDAHTIMFKKVSGTATARINFSSITFTPAAAPATHDVFGEKYAYVYKVDNGYAIDFLGGLKAIEGYTDVGFEISVDGAAAQDYSTRYVYKTITVNDEEMTAEDFDAEYIFAVTKDDIAASAEKVTITPYIIDANGNKISHYGKTLTIDLSTLA